MCQKDQKTQNFTLKSQEIHGNAFDYSKSNYLDSKTKIEIVCKVHGSFWQTSTNHYYGKGCPACVLENRTHKISKHIQRFKEIHGDLYDYSESRGTHSHDNITIICKKHGKFTQQIYNHKKGHGCPDCGRDEVSNDLENVIRRCNEVHRNLYDYSLVKYVNNYTKVKIICCKHGIFKQSIHSHAKGRGCPHCCTSKGELLIKQWLEDNKFEFEQQKTFSNCKHKHKLQFDFYTPEYHALIEYNGEQHYKPIDYFGGLSAFKLNQKRDQIKRLFAKNNGFKLLEIPYTMSNEEIITLLNDNLKPNV